MKPTSVGVLTTFMMIFSLLLILLIYPLLNTAVSDISKQSVYYTYYTFNNLIASSMKSGSASATKLYFAPRYVLFSAYFDEDSDIPFFVFEGQNLNSIAVNQDDFGLFNQIVKSSTNRRFLNDNDKNRKELSKCVGHACLCLGEVPTLAVLDKDYLVPNACVEICWGENPPDYQACLLNTPTSSYKTPRELMSICNAQLAADGNPVCKKCVDYMSDYDNKFNLIHNGPVDILAISADRTHSNRENFRKLEEFSSSMKFSFISNVLECKPLSDVASNIGKSSYCSSNSNSPYLLYYGDSGIFAMMSSSSAGADGRINASKVLFNLINMEYNQDDDFSPERCDNDISFMEAEAVE